MIRMNYKSRQEVLLLARIAKVILEA